VRPASDQLPIEGLFALGDLVDLLWTELRPIEPAQQAMVVHAKGFPELLARHGQPIVPEHSGPALIMDIGADDQHTIHIPEDSAQPVFQRQSSSP